MKNLKQFKIFVFLLLLLTSKAISGDHLLKTWPIGSAYLLPKGRLEVGLFQTFRYGLSHRLEIATHPILDIWIPSLSVKWAHKTFLGFDFTTRHSIYYPTPLMRLVAREGLGGLISPEFEIPFMLSIYNEVLFSKFLTRNNFMTVRMGLNFALKGDEIDERTTIDLPLIFPRFAVFYNRYLLRGGLGFQGSILNWLHYKLDGDVFIIPGADEDFTMEHQGFLILGKSTRFRFFIGYKLIYGEYPFGTQWHLLTPLFNFAWAFNLKSN